MQNIVEDNFDFWAELEKDNHIISTEEHCLLSKEPLTLNYVSLPCGHRFNYQPLCKEMVSIKYTKTVYNRTLNLQRHQTCCPYCRTIFNTLLPKIPIYDMKLPKYICSSTNCFPRKQCSYTFKRGKNKGTTCNQPGFDTEKGTTCKTHHKL